MSQLAQRLAALSPEKLMLLERRVKERNGGVSPPAVPQVQNEKIRALSIAQARLWFLDQLEPGSAVYNIPAAVMLPGQMNVEALRWSLNEIVRRHEVLRTRFMSVDGEPAQVIMPSLQLELPVHDLRGIAASERQAEVARLTGEEARRPFDLGTGPLLRAQLLRVTDEQMVLLLTMHHIISDGWSVGIFFQELSALYEAWHQGRRESPLPALAIQYADYAQWQRERLSGAALAEMLGYWREQLADAPGVLELPLDRVRPAVQSFRGETRMFQLGEELTRRLRELSQRQGVTLFMTLLAAFKVLLYRYTGEEDIVVGTPIAGRNRAEIEGLIGFFTNSLVLRTTLSDKPRFVELLQRVRAVTLGAYEHQDLPFEKLVEELQPERSLSHNPLFQVLFSLQNNPTLAGLGNQPAAGQLPEINTGSAKFDLALMMSEAGPELSGGFEYNTDLFEAATIERLEGHYRQLLEAIVREPEQRVTALRLLTDSEVAQLRQWNETKVEYGDAGACLHEVFEAQVKRTPERVAVVEGERNWSYRELNERANQIARQLQQAGVRAEERVGICMERSLEMTAGILGVMKAGGAYVPLDPAYPRERLGLMVRDAEARVVLTQSPLREQLPGEVEQVVCLDEAAASEGEYEPSEVNQDNLAYVIYTSGSTGVPKGAMISHRSALNHMRWMLACCSVTENDRVLYKTPLHFDASVSEFFLALLSGACLVVARHGGHTESDYLVQIAAEQNVTILQGVPSLMRMLSDEPGLSSCKSLRLLVSGGETLPAELPERFFARLNVDLINIYGPTEATIDATSWKCTRNGGETVPIGHPLPNTQIHILDREQQLVPVGVPGELYIGGMAVSRGYLNRADLTAQSFVPDPFSDEPGQRLFRTGDLARRRPDGALEFLGRADHQIKLRGVRIELDEIEATLEEHGAVRHAAVLLRQFAPGDHRLVGYILPKNGERPSTTDLRTFLSEKLPAAMVPSVFVFLETLPLMPNGKLNRRALPAPDTGSRELDTVYIAPRNHIEEKLAAIWAEVLGQKQIGIHDNFFDLGGHSLLATRILSRVREALKIEMPLRSLFQTSTVAGMAEVAAQMPASTEEELSAASITTIYGATDAELPDRVAQLSDEEVDLLLNRMMAGNEALADVQSVPAPYMQSNEPGFAKPPAQPSSSLPAQQEIRFDSASVSPVNAQAQFEEAYINYVRSTQEVWAAAQRQSREAYFAYVQTLRQLWMQADVTKLDPNALFAISQVMAMAAISTANMQSVIPWPQENGFW